MKVVDEPIEAYIDIQIVLIEQPQLQVTVDIILLQDLVEFHS
jgi:hypothetical protein